MRIIAIVKEDGFIDEMDLSVEDARERIRDAADAVNGDLRTDYSGRGMYGRTCYGIVTGTPLDAAAVAGILGGKLDSMGLDAIVYWPNVAGDSDKSDDAPEAR